MTQAMTILASVDPPKRLLINEQIVADAANACPALRARLAVPGSGNDKYTIGLVAAISKIWEAFDANGIANELAGITDEYMGETDSMIASGSKDLIWIYEELPLIVQMVQDSPKEKSEAKAGIILAFVTAARYFISKSIPAAPEQGEESFEDNQIVALSEPVRQQEVLPKPKRGYRPDLRDVVGDLMKAGIPWDMINIVPVMNEGVVSFEIRGTISSMDTDTETVDFKSIATINALFMKATGKDVKLKSDGPIYFYLEV